MKRVKKWVKSVYSSDALGDGKPTSYLMEILIIEACERYCKRYGWDMERLDVIEIDDFDNFARE